MSFRYEHGQITDNYDEQEAIDSWYQEYPIVSGIVEELDGKTVIECNGYIYEIDEKVFKDGDILDGQIIKGKFIPL